MISEERTSKEQPSQSEPQNAPCNFEINPFFDQNKATWCRDNWFHGSAINSLVVLSAPGMVHVFMELTWGLVYGRIACWRFTLMTHLCETVLGGDRLETAIFVILTKILVTGSCGKRLGHWRNFGQMKWECRNLDEIFVAVCTGILLLVMFSNATSDENIKMIFSFHGIPAWVKHVGPRV